MIAMLNLMSSALVSGYHIFMEFYESQTLIFEKNHLESLDWAVIIFPTQDI